MPEMRLDGLVVLPFNSFTLPQRSFESRMGRVSEKCDTFPDMISCPIRLERLCALSTQPFLISLFIHMIGSCNSIDLQVNRKGGWLVIGWANDRVPMVVPCGVWSSAVTSSIASSFAGGVVVGNVVTSDRDTKADSIIIAGAVIFAGGVIATKGCAASDIA